MHSTCTVRRGGRWQVAGMGRGQAQGGVASRLIDKCLDPVLGPPSSAPKAARPRRRALRGTYPTDAAEKRFSGHRSSQRKIGGGLPPLTPSTNRQPRQSTTVNNHLARYPRSFPCNRQSTNYPTLTMSNAELASSYAALILADEGVEITVREKPSPRPDPPPSSRSCRIPP